MVSIVHRGKAVGDTIRDGLVADLKMAWEFRSLNRFLPLVSGGVLDNLCYQAGSTYNAPSVSDTQFGNKDFCVAFLINNLIPNGSSYAYEMFFAADRFNSGQREVAISPSKPSLGSWAVYVDFGDGGANLPLRLTIPISYAVWGLVVINHDSVNKTGTSYLNGTLINTVTYTGTLGTIAADRNFGYRNTGAGNDGTLSNSKAQYLYKWDRLLTLAEINWLYNSGNFRFLS